jgi:hypothetical protein
MDTLSPATIPEVGDCTWTLKFWERQGVACDSIQRETDKDLHLLSIPGS